MSENLLKKLFSRIQVHPNFLEILFLFGDKIGPVEESFSSFFSHCRPYNVDNPYIEPTCSYGTLSRFTKGTELNYARYWLQYKIRRSPYEVISN